MDTKRNQTLEEIEENKIVNEHYQNRVMLIKKLLKTSRLATVDLCFHIAGEIYVTVVGGFTDVDMHAEVYCG